MRHSAFAPITRTVVALIATGIVAALFIWAFATPTMHMDPITFHVDAIRINGYAIITAMVILVDLALLLYFASKPARSDERVWLMLYMVIAIVYSASVVLMMISADKAAALIWSDFGTIDVFVGPAIYLFALNYTNQSERRFPGLTVLLLGASFMLITFETSTPIVFGTGTSAALATPWGWDYRAAVGPAIDLIAVWYYVLLISAECRLLSFRRHSQNPILRRQSLLFMVAISIPIGLGALFDLILPMFNINSIPPLAPLLTILTAGLLVYGALRYQVLSINPAVFSNTILSMMKEAVVVVDTKCRILFVNENGEAALGLKTRRTGTTALLPHLLSQSADALRVAIQKPDAETLNIEQVDIAQPMGVLAPVHVTGSKLRVPGIEAWVLVLEDIKVALDIRHQIEREVKVRTSQLHKAQSYLESSIASLQQGFVLVDATLRVESVNHVATHIFKLPAESAPHSFGDVVRQVSWGDPLVDTLGRVIKTGKPRQLDISSPDGSFYQLYVTPVLAKEHIIGATVIVEDVTEQKILDRSKDEFFSIASHELRTPLTAIRGNMSMAKDYFAAVLKDPALKELVDDTHTASVRLIEIVNDFLDSSKLEQGKMVFNLAPVTLKPLFVSIKSDLQSLAEQQSDQIVFSDLDNLPQVIADETRLRQIFYNMLSNAIKYSERATITVTGQREGSKLRIRVADTGKGISPESQKLLFHKFQQAGDSLLTRDNTKGTGLGLYIAKLLADNMHGSIELEHSEVGKGSVFAVVMPVADK